MGRMVPGRGALGVSPWPLAGRGWIRPLGTRSNRDPGAPPGGALGHPAGPIAKELPGVAQPRRSARSLPQRRPLSGTQSSCSPAAAAAAAAHLGARTWPEPRAASGPCRLECVRPLGAATRLTCPSAAQGVD